MSAEQLDVDDVQDANGVLEEGKTVEILLDDGRVLVSRIRQIQDGDFECPEDSCFRKFDSPRGVKTHVGKFHPELVAKECPECHQVFHPNPRSQIYCSVECKDSHKSNRKTLFCQNCSRSFEVKASHADDRKHCCRDCKNESNREIRDCPTCGGEFEVYLSSPQTYCSRDCFNNRTTENKREQRECPECGDTFEVYPSEDTTFCSLECYSASRWVTKECPMCGGEFESKKDKSLSKEHCSQACMYERRRSDPRPDDPAKLLKELIREDREPDDVIGRAYAHLGPRWSQEDVAAFYWLLESQDYEEAADAAGASSELVLEIAARAVGASNVEGPVVREQIERADTRLELQDALRVDRQGAKRLIDWVGMDKAFESRTKDIVQDLREKTAEESWPGVEG